MNKEEFEALVYDVYSESPERPFAKDQSTVVFRHSENLKWFAIIMTIPKKRLDAAADGKIDVVNLKCDEEIIYSLLQESGLYPAYHMSKRHWITVALDGSVSAETVKWLLGISFELTSTKITRQKHT